MRGGLTLLWGVPSVLKGRGGEAVNPPNLRCGMEVGRVPPLGTAPPWIRPPQTLLYGGVPILCWRLWGQQWTPPTHSQMEDGDVQTPPQ